jgi:hypothetical protein
LGFVGPEDEQIVPGPGGLGLIEPAERMAS